MVHNHQLIDSTPKKLIILLDPRSVTEEETIEFAQDAKDIPILRFNLKSFKSPISFTVKPYKCIRNLK